jgi:hypothetical protein
MRHEWRESGWVGLILSLWGMVWGNQRRFSRPAPAIDDENRM